MIKKITILTVLIITAHIGYSQVYINPDSINFVGPIIIDGDTLPNVELAEVLILPPKTFKNRRERRRYTRLMYNVKKAYPFAIIARYELGIMNDSLQYIHGDKARKEFIKHYEREMFIRYEDDLRKLTFSQGRILIKLVYREIGNTSYDLVKEYRGSFSAVFWQGVARIFGSNLKATYDPLGEDADIERIVRMIEAGII